LQEPALLPEAILDALRLPHTRDGDPFSRIVACLEGARSLLVMDNLEHLAAPTADFIGHLLARLPLLSCLATSARSLVVTGDREIPVSPLPVPEAAEQGPAAGNTKDAPRRFSSKSGTDIRVLASVPSVQLFVDRAQAVLPDFQLTARNAAGVASICAALEG